MIENISYAGLSKGQKLCREKEEGNREYKFKLTGLTDEQRNHRITQVDIHLFINSKFSNNNNNILKLNWRLNEGNDSAVYLIGVEVRTRSLLYDKKILKAY